MPAKLGNQEIRKGLNRHKRLRHRRSNEAFGTKVWKGRRVLQTCSLRHIHVRPRDISYYHVGGLCGLSPIELIEARSIRSVYD